MPEVKPGKSSTEFKVVLLNYIAGLFLITAGTWLQHKGMDATNILGMGTVLLMGNGVAYGAMRTSNKNAVARAQAAITSQPSEEVAE